MMFSKYDVYTTVQSLYCYPGSDVLKNKLNEGFPHLYRQQEIEVETPDGKAKGMVYLMKRGQISPPSQGYLQTIWDGYKANGMDTSYLVEAAARAYDYASDLNIKYDESLDESEDEDFDLDNDIQMSFKL